MTAWLRPPRRRHATRRWQRYSLVLFLLSVLGSSAAPPPATATDLRSVLTQYALTSWSKKDGLPNASIFVLQQDADGYLWVGTQAGPYRFDGVRFTPWADLVGTSVPAQSVRALNAASDGSMWIGFGDEGGIAVFKRGLQRRYDAGSGLPAAPVTMLIEHPAGTYWAGTPFGLFRLHEERWERVGSAHNVPDGPINVGTVTTDGRLLVGSSRVLLELNARTQQFVSIARFSENPRALVEDPMGQVTVSDQIVGYRRVDAAPAPGTPSERGRGRALLRDRHGNLWVGTAGQGLWRVRFGDNGHVLTVEHANALTGLLADGVLALTEDREGNIWVGTTEGINRLTPYKVAQVTNRGLVAGVEPGPDDTLWVGTVDELLSMSNPEAANRMAPRLLGGSRLRALHTDHAGTLWVATDRGLTRWAHDALRPVPVGGGTMPTHIDTITAAPPAGAWVFDAERGLLRWRNGRFAAVPLPPQIGRTRVEAAFTDSGGRAWFALSSGHVLVILGEDLRVYGREDGLSAGIYQAIYEDRQQIVWLGGTEGISRYADERFITVRSDAGFPVADLTAIIEDTRGDLWIGSSVGILRWKPADFDRLLQDPAYHAQYLLLDRSDGLAGLPFAYSRNRRAIRSVDGRLWFVTGRGLTVVDPAALDKVAPPAAVRIENVLADGVPLGLDDDLTLPAGTSRVEFEYTAVNLTSPLRQKFRYKLEGFDRDWIEGGTKRQAVYTNLPPRRYRFLLSSTDQQGEWVQGQVHWQFAIRPMFYQTGWFLTIVVAAVVLGVGGAWRLHVRRVRRSFALLLGERARLSRELHDTLLQSLVGVALQFDAIANDPQFNFSSAQKQQFVRMRRRVEEYMREARQSIADLRFPRIGTHDLAAALRDAADRAINGTPIRFTFEQRGIPHAIPVRIEEQLLKIGREAIGNAVRHARADSIATELEFADGTLRLIVSDNGGGFEPDANTDGHYGLTSMRERAEDIDGHLTIHTAKGHGTRVEAVVPLAPARGRLHDEVATH